MKKQLIKLGCAALTLFAVTSAQAITGTIGFTGSYMQNGGTLGELDTATSMSITTVAVQSADGDLTGAASPTFASPIGVNGNAPSLVGSQLWSVLVGLDTYDFVVGTSAQTFTSESQLNLAGSGVMRLNGGDDTAGTWQLGFGVTRAGTLMTFTWQATSGAAPTVPDGGATVVLLGAALAGLGLARRKLMA